MANYSPAWKSGEFGVKDEERFLQWVQSFGGEVGFDREVKESQVSFTLQQGDTSESGIPCMRYNPDTYKWVDCDFAKELASHLAEDSIAVLQEVGAEKLRYLVGYAVAVRSDGEILQISIEDIYREIHEEWGFSLILGRIADANR